MPYSISPRIAHQTVDGEVVLIDLAGARMLGLNAVGSFIWPLLAEQDEETIAHRVCEQFDVDIETARADVRGFASDLILRGLLTSGP